MQKRVSCIHAFRNFLFSMIKVSVIVPVYNVEKYLGKCLQSLAEQTLEELEILIINDGSTDNSQEIIDHYHQKYPEKIRSFSKENGGLSDARNFGLDRASGDFIGFVDSDDYVLPSMFKEMYRLAMLHQAQMVICNLQKVDENGIVKQKLTQIPHLPEKIELKTNMSVFSDISYFACNKLFDKKLFRHHRFKKGVHFEDIQLIPQMLLECDVIAQTQVFHYQYLERPDSITRTHNFNGLDILHAVEDVEKCFHESKYRDQTTALKNFQILEGVYTFLAYLAYVKDGNIRRTMEDYYNHFVASRLTMSQILKYKRFGKNYLLSLPLGKKIFYLLYFTGQKALLRRII